jgi:hypothetical protein
MRPNPRRIPETGFPVLIAASMTWFPSGRNRYGVQGVHLNPPGLFLCTSMPFIWSTLSACLPSSTPWLRGPVSPRFPSHLAFFNYAFIFGGTLGNISWFISGLLSQGVLGVPQDH